MREGVTQRAYVTFNVTPLAPPVRRLKLEGVTRGTQNFLYIFFLGPTMKRNKGGGEKVEKGENVRYPCRPTAYSRLRSGLNGVTIAKSFASPPAFASPPKWSVETKFR